MSSRLLYMPQRRCLHILTAAVDVDISIALGTLSYILLPRLEVYLSHIMKPETCDISLSYTHLE